MGMPPAKFHLAVSSLSWLVWQPHTPAHVGLILLQPQKPHGRLRSYQFPPLWESLPVSTHWLMRSWGRARWRNTTNIANSCWCTTNSAVLYKNTANLQTQAVWEMLALIMWKHHLSWSSWMLQRSRSLGKMDCSHKFNIQSLTVDTRCA